MKNDLNIIGGDFNFWQSVLDVNKNITWCHYISRKTFFEFKRDCDVVDIYRGMLTYRYFLDTNLLKM